MQIGFNNKIIDLSTPIVMGIINVTPDSFFKGSRFTSDKSILHSVDKIIEDGGTIIDIGGYSTRPMAENISQDEEIKRISDALNIIKKKHPDMKISIDTFRSGVVRYVAQNFDSPLINDISGGTMDDLMFETIADLGLTYVLTHTKGTPQTMQNLCNYDNVISEVMAFLVKKLAQLHILGVKNIIIDPGFGFAKTTEQNFKLLKKLSYLRELDVPILAGISRKSMIYNTLNNTPADALNGTTAAHMLALAGGASIIRAHDVKEAIEAIKIFNAYQNC